MTHVHAFTPSRSAREEAERLAEEFDRKESEEES